MGFIVAGTCFLLSIFAWKRTKNWSSPSCIFLGMWSVIFFLTQMRLFMLYKVTFTTWIIFWLGGISFYVGDELSNKFRFKVSGIYSKKKDKEFYVFSKKIYRCVLSFVLILYGIECFKTLKLVLAGTSLSSIRAAYFGVTQIEGLQNSIFQSGIATYFNYLKNGIYNIVVAVSIYAYFEKKKTKFLFVGTLLVIMRTISTGGRFELVTLSLQLFVCLLLCKDTVKDFWSKEISWIKRRIKGIFLILVSLVVSVTIVRGTLWSELGKMFYTYLCSGPVLCDLHIQDIDSKGIMSFPIAGGYGFFAILFPILNKVGMPYPEKYILTANQVMTGQNWWKIGEDMYSNAFLTPFYYLYADLRIVGVIIGMIVLGWFMGTVFKKIKKEKSARAVILYLILVTFIIKTIQSYPFSSEISVVTLIIYYLL